MPSNVSLQQTGGPKHRVVPSPLSSQVPLPGARPAPAAELYALGRHTAPSTIVYLSLVAPAFIAVMGLYLSLSFGRDLYFGLASREWPHVTGYVTKRGIHIGSMAHHDSAAVLVYRYRVLGIHYTSNRYDFAGRNVDMAGTLLLDHKIGRGVTVWHHPSRPARAVLARGIVRANITRFIAALCMLASGVVWMSLTV